MAALLLMCMPFTWGLATAVNWLPLRSTRFAFVHLYDSCVFKDVLPLPASKTRGFRAQGRPPAALITTCLLGEPAAAWLMDKHEMTACCLLPCRVSPYCKSACSCAQQDVARLPFGS